MAAVIGYEIQEQACLSDVGIRRSHNQDAFAVLMADDETEWREKGHFLLVADGMGGHAVGELASKRAVDLIPHSFQKYVGQGIPSALKRAFLEANGSIHQLGQQNPEFENTGTTSSALLLSKEGAWIAHVGDSRVYRIRGGYVEQISFDHSWQWELARRQGLDPSEVDVQSNVIVRSLGPQAKVEVDIEGPHPIYPGDAYLLCSDGLSNQIPDGELGAIINAMAPRAAAQFLVDLANLRGGPDNITVVLAKLPGESPPSHAEIKLRQQQSGLKALLFTRVPWAGIALGAGITLALVALVLVVKELNRLAIATFLLAGTVLMIGLIGLRQSLSMRGEGETEVDHAPPRIYRRTSCKVDRNMIERWSQMEKALREQAHGTNWPVDWEEHRRFHANAVALLEKDDFVGSFRDYCHAVAVLTEGLRRMRNRGETFKPLW